MVQSIISGDYLLTLVLADRERKKNIGERRFRPLSLAVSHSLTGCFNFYYQRYFQNTSLPCRSIAGVAETRRGVRKDGGVNPDC